MKKALLSLLLLLFFFLTAFAQPSPELKKIPLKKVASVSKTYKASPILAKMAASLPTKTFNVNGRKSTLRLIAVDNPSLKKAGGLAGIEGIKQKSKIVDKKENGGDYCETYEMSLSAESEDFDVPYSTQASYIYPGAAYMYDDYYSNTVSPKSLTWARNPIYLQASSSSAFGETELVENPTSINLQQAVGKIKKAIPSNATNASTSIKMISVYDETDFRFKVNAGGGGMGFKADASFGISNNSRKSYFMIDVVQSIYTINAILPENDSALFFKEVERNKTPGALFIASVSYGRRVLGVVETEFESEQMMASFKASYTAGFAGGYAGLDMMNGMKREKTTVKLFFAGGDANAITVPNATASSVQAAINNYLRSGTTQNAVPVKFTFRNMAMSAMRYESATDKYTNQQCTPKMKDQNYKVTVNLRSVRNETNGNEEIKFGLVESIAFYKNGKLLNTDALVKPIVNWGGGKGMGPMAATEQPRTFKGNTMIDRSISQQYSQQEIFEGNARVDLVTKYIAMFATRAFGSTNDKANPKSEQVLLKDVANSQSGGGSLNKEVRINFNNRVFTLSFMISVTPIK